MKRKRITEEQIMGFLKEGEADVKTDDICRRHGISSATFYSWRKKYGGMEAGYAKRLRALETENAKLKRIFADQMLDMSAMRGLVQKSTGRPMAKRRTVGFPMTEHGVSERRTCRIVGLAGCLQRYRPMPKDDEATVKRMKKLASENRRHGCLGLRAMLRREGLVVNHKRTYWLGTELGLQVRTRKRRKPPRKDRVAPTVPERPIQRWSLDFVSDRLAACRRFCVPNIVDDNSRFCAGQIVDVSISGARVARFLDDLALRIGLAEEIILNNGPEGTSKAMSVRSERTGVRLWLIQSGKPVQNALVESFNGKFRDACLNLHWVRSLRHARAEIGRWQNHFNTKRPHSTLGYLTPRECLMETTAPTLETLAVSALPLNTDTQSEDSRSNRPSWRGKIRHI